MKFWTREQFEQFIAVVDDPMYHALFTFMFFTGRRKGELFALYKTDVKSDKITFNKSVNRRTFGMETWEITTTKADKSCVIPISTPVREEIKRYTPPADGQFYFGGKKPLAPTTVERKFKYYTQLAGVPQIRIHDLRHSYASLVIHLGGSVYTVAFLLSDTVEMVLKTYGHLMESDMLDILAKI
jgi:integrase